MAARAGLGWELVGEECASVLGFAVAGPSGGLAGAGVETGSAAGAVVVDFSGASVLFAILSFAILFSAEAGFTSAALAWTASGRRARIGGAGMASPEDESEDDDHGGDRDDAPGNFARRFQREIFAAGTNVLGTGELQAGKFLGCWRRFGSYDRLERFDGMRFFGARSGWRYARRRGLRIPDFVSIDLRLAQASKVIGDGVLRIEAEMFGVGADETFVEDAAGQLVEMFFFDGLQHARADLGDVGNVIVRELFFLARFAKFVAEFAHWIVEGTAE